MKCSDLYGDVNISIFSVKNELDRGACHHLKVTPIGTATWTKTSSSMEECV